MQQDVEMYASPTTLKDRMMSTTIYTTIYTAVATISVCCAVFYNIPKPEPITKYVDVVRWVEYTEQISVPRAPTQLESIEALQITLDGGYESLKYRALTQITSPPTPARKPRGV